MDRITENTLQFDMFEILFTDISVTVEHWEAVEGVPGLQRYYQLYTSCKYVCRRNVYSCCGFLLDTVITQRCKSFFQDDAKKHDRFAKSRYQV